MSDRATAVGGGRPFAWGAPSIRVLMLLLLMAVLLPATAAWAWFLRVEVEQARSAAELRVQLLVDGTVATLERMLQDQREVLQRFAERPRVRALDPGDFDPGVAEYVRIHPEFNTLTVRDRDARPVFSSRPNPNTPQVFASFPWFREGISARRFVASDAFRGTITGRWVTVLTQPVLDLNGEIGGLMSLSVDLLALNQRVLGAVPQGAVVAVTDRQDRYLLRSADAASWLGKSGPGKALAETRGQRKGVLAATGPDGVRRLYVFATMPGTGWRVVAGLPEDQVLAAHRELLWRSVLVGVGMLLLSAAAAWRVGRAIVGPVDGLSDAARRVAEGDLQAQAPVQGPAEIRAVAQQFNHMLAARAAAEVALRDSEGNLAITLQSIGDAVVATDLEGRVTRMNATAARLTGWPLAEALGQRLADVFRIVDSRTGEPAVDPVQRVMESGAVVGLANHTALRARDGTVFQIADSAAPIRDDAGRTLGVVLVFSDVTERYRVEQELRANARVLRQRDRALAEISQGVVMTDAEGRITYVNPGFERLTGHAEADVMGRTPDFLRAPGAAPGTVAEIVQALRDGKAFHGEIEICRKDGTPLWVALDLSPLRDAEGVLTGFVAAQRDITERRQAEATRSDLEAQLRESQKMESIGTLAGGIAHDFNNILGAVLGNVALAREDVGPGHPALQSLEQIDRASRRARDLVQQILTFSRRRAQALVVQPLGPVVQETLALLRTTLPAMVELRTSVPAQPLYVAADPTQIQQVLMNLGTNAWHALSGRAGHLEVGLGERLLDAAASQRLGGLAAGRYAHLWVRDDGVGMDQATQDHMFEPFFTTKPVGDGTGLGLSVVHGIVSAHHGGIAVTSAPGRGTTVDVYLPIAEPAAAEDPAAAVAVHTPQGSGEQVLYVDDDEVMRLMVSRLLERAGWRVGTAAGADEALARVEASPGAVDALVTDFRMPGSSGLELALRARRLRPGLPILITSGFLSDELRQGAVAVGVRHLLPKQDLFEILPDVLHQALSEARSDSPTPPAGPTARSSPGTPPPAPG